MIIRAKLYVIRRTPQTRYVRRPITVTWSVRGAQKRWRCGTAATNARAVTDDGCASLQSACVSFLAGKLLWPSPIDWNAKLGLRVSSVTTNLGPSARLRKDVYRPPPSDRTGRKPKINPIKCYWVVMLC